MHNNTLLANNFYFARNNLRNNTFEKMSSWKQKQRGKGKNVSLRNHPDTIANADLYH